MQSHLFSIPKDQFLQLQFLKWRNSLPDPNSTYHFYLARNAIYSALKLLKIDPNSTVLLPSYICRAAVEPVSAYGCRVVYYGIQENCAADIDDLERKLEGNARLVLAVHYFGFPQQMDQIRKLCDSRGAKLIEDCAHQLGGLGQGPLGEGPGDVRIFSLRKQLPVYDGALLHMRSPIDLPIQWQLDDFMHTMKATLDLLSYSARRGKPGSQGALASAGRTVKKLLRNRLLSRETQTELKKISETGSDFSADMATMPMTRISRWIYRHMDFDKIMERRRENYVFLSNALRTERRITLLYPELDEGVCPWVLPFHIRGFKDAHLRMRAEGIPAVTWGGVRPESLTRGDYPEADFLYDNLIFLPVHQSLKRNDLALISTTVSRVLRASE